MKERGRKETLTDAEVERVVAAIADLVTKYGTQSALSNAIKEDQPGVSLSYQTIGKYLKKEARPGYGVARIIAAQKGISDAQLLGRPLRDLTESEFPLVRDIDGWDEAAAEARRLNSRISQEQIEAVGNTATQRPPSPVTATFIIAMANAFEMGHAAAEAETARARADLERERDRRGRPRKK